MTTRPFMACVAAFCVLALAAPAALPQAPDGTIAGIVVDELGRPVPNGGVAAYTAGNATTPRGTAQTDATGAFSIAGLPAGWYSVGAAALGHVNVAFGQHFPSAPPVMISVADGARRDIRVVLPKSSVITGVVKDHTGTPAPGARVRALRWVARYGGRDLEAVETTITNRLGVYRLFGLTAGRYLVITEPVSTIGAVLPAGRGPVRALATYYPGTTSAARAVPVTVSSGDTVAGIDMAIALTPTGSIAVDVINPTWFTVVGLRGEWRDVSEGPDAEAQTIRGGSISNVKNGSPALVVPLIPAGRHIITVRADVRGNEGGPPPLPLFGFAELTTTGGSDRVSVRLEAGTTVTGRFALDRAAPLPDPGRLAPKLIGVGGPFDSDANGWMRADVTAFGFTVAGIPAGDYRLRLDAPEPWRVASATAGEYDLLDGALPVRSGLEPPVIDVTLTDRRTFLSGTVADDSGAARYDQLVVAFPADPARRTELSRWIRIAQPDIDGRWGLLDLPPGDYFVAAADIDWDPALEPDRLITLESGARRVTLTRDAPVTVNLQVIR